MKAPFFRTGFNSDNDADSLATALSPTGLSLTVQEQAEDADINTIVRRFGLTGQLPENVAIPRTGDFTTITDYHGAMNIVAAADSAFMEMPANVRARFDNDPGKFLDFCYDPKNRDEALSLGLLRDDLPPSPLNVPPQDLPPAPSNVAPQGISPADKGKDASAASQA